MKAVILAAGMGTRLMPSTKYTPKCLTKVHGHAILDYQLSALKQCDITDIAIVIGHNADKIKTHIQEKGVGVTFIESEDYATTNSARSLWLSKSFVEDDTEGFLVLNSDLIFTPEMLKALIDSEPEDAIVIEHAPEIDSDMVKVEMNEQKIAHMSKDLPLEKAEAIAIGPVLFSQQGGRKYLASLENTPNNWVFYAVSDFAKVHPFYGVQNPGHTWAEIDTPEDLKEAHEKIPEDFMNM